MKEFIINEEFDQAIINPEGSIEISGLRSRGAFNIVRDAASAGIRSSMSKLSVAEKCCVLIEVEHDAIVLKNNELSILLNPDEYPFEAIIIRTKSMRVEANEPDHDLEYHDKKCEEANNES